MAFSFESLREPAYFAENRLPPHSDHLWYSSREALEEGREPLRHSLNGPWRFAYARNEGQVPAGFERADFDCHAWASIAVPAHIQMEGYGVPQYVNQQYPWDGWEALAPGELPEAFNPVACYVKYFFLPEAMRGKRVFLSFQGVESCAAVWLNGNYIGYSANSFSPCEFELSKFLCEGENKLALRVYKWNAGSWLEDQDFFRFSGIYRDVYLYAVPDVHLQDLKVVPTLDGGLEKGKVLLSGTILGEGAWQLSVVADGRVWAMLRGSGNTFSTAVTVERPELWSAEQPNLYHLELTLFDEKGAIQEIVTQKIGFRRFECKDGLMLLNDKRIVFKGVNRHDFSGRAGRAVTEEEIRRDLLTMKRNNINALRTSHYPNSRAVYELCDELGIYVLAENNMETHGTWQNSSDPLHEALPCDHMEWEPMLLDRIEATYQTAKNHPSVLIWSLGNESFGGKVIRNMARYLRALDGTRLIHYEGVFHDRRYSDESSDMESQMYPSAASIRAFLDEHPDKPFLCCEYTHSMGNSNGGMNRYTDLTDTEPRYQGGFIWDYIDQAICGRDRYGETAYYYGGDLGDRPCDYAFSGNGICYADGSETPKMAEVKYNYQNLSVQVEPERMTVVNKHLFTPSSAYDCVVTLERDGRQVCQRKLHTDVPPLERRTYPLPFERQERPGEYAVTVSFRLKEDQPWAARGHEVAFGQGVYRVAAPAVVRRDAPLRVVDTMFNVGVTGGDHRVLFSKLDGGLSSYQYGGVEMLKAIPMPNFWRPVVDNDLGGQVNLRCAQWKAGSQFVTHRQYGKGYWNPEYDPAVEEKDGAVTVTYRYYMPTSPASGCQVAYTVCPSGEVRCTLTYEPVAGLPPMPEFGMLFKLDADYHHLEWYGDGPGESYADRCGGVRLGIWRDKVERQMARYLRPQESGAHTGVRWAKVTDERGRGLCFSGDGMMFSALPWTPHEIDCAQHPFELPRVHYTVVRCALKQMGVGGDDTWGSVPHPEYWLDAERPLSFTFQFRGCMRE